MKKLTITAAALLFTTAALAGDNRNGPDFGGNSSATAVAAASAKAVQGQQQTQSQTSTYNESNAVSSAIAPSIGGGTCNVGIGLGSAVNSLSLSTGFSWRNIPCAVQHEAAQLYDMGLRDAAILHLAKHHARMRATLLNAGIVAKK